MRTRKRYAKEFIAYSGGLTTSRNWNVAGLSSSIALANALRTKYMAHVANDTEHVSVHTAGQVTAAAAVTLATLLTLVNDLTAKYVLHNTDAAATTPTYHQADVGSGNALAASTTVTTLAGAITRLNDIKAKFNLHDADATGHTVGSTQQVSTADAALGAKILVTNTNVVAGMGVTWAILNDGTGNVTGVSAEAVNGGIEFTFSADPQDDAIITYMVAA